MGLLHRLTSRDAPAVWRAETRLLHAVGRVRPPKAVQWITTAVCDLTCPHCYSHAGRKVAGELDADEATRLVVDECVKLGSPTLVLAGGEPTLAKSFAAVVEHAHARGVPWAMHTHGGRCRDLEPLFQRCPPSMVAVSLDGPRAYHDAFRGRAGSFDNAVAAITMFKAIGVEEVVAGTTVTRQNAGLLPAVMPTVLASGADSWGLHLVTPEGRGGEHTDILPTARQLARVAGLARRLRSVMHVELDNEWGSAGRDDAFYRDGRFACGAGRVSCVVSAAGDVMPCTTTDAAESAGNVRDRPLNRIWAEGFGGFRGDRGEGGRPDPRGDDADCWLQTRHGRSCRGAAFFGRDDVSSPTTFHPLTVRAAPATPKQIAPPPRRRSVAHGRLTRGAARAAAVLAVMAGWQSDALAQSPARAADRDDGERSADAPPIDAEAARAWWRWRQDLRLAALRSADSDAAFDQGVDAVSRLRATGDLSDERRNAAAQAFIRRLPARKLAAMLAGELEIAPAAPVSVATLTAALDDMEATGVFDHYLLGFLWRKSGEAVANDDPPAAEAVAALYRRFHRHARVTNALILAAADAPAVDASPRAWMSKAGPSVEVRRAAADAERAVVAGFAKAWADADAGTWSRDGRVLLALRGDTPVTVLRGDGGEASIEPGDRFALRRLDVIVIPAEGADTARLEHPLGGAEGFRPGALTAWSLPRHLPPDAATRITALVARAAADPEDDAAADQLDDALPLAHDAIRAALHARPDAPGAPLLRTLLTRFDEALSRGLAAPAEPPPPPAPAQ